jgi:hypothetical protein
VVLAPLAVLLDEVPSVQRGDQPEGRRLVHTEFGSDLGDTGISPLGQQVQDRDGPIHGLNL